MAEEGEEIILTSEQQLQKELELSASFFTNNPIYDNINLLDYTVPGPEFSYRWNKALKQWEPTTKEVQDETTHALLSGVRNDLAAIEIDVEIDSDAEAHRLLSGTNLLLEGVRADLKAIEIDVEIDSDVETHRLLSGVIDLLEESDDETHRLLKSISGEVGERGEQNNSLLESISEEILSQGNQTQDLLSTINHTIFESLENNNDSLKSISGILLDFNNDINENSLNTIELLQGVRSDLSNIHIDVEVDSDTQTHALLEELISSNDELLLNTNTLLSGVREDLSNIHIDVEVDSDTQTHELLSTILQENEQYNLQTNLSLSGIRSDLSNIHIDVEVDSDAQTHALLEELIDFNDDTNALLSGVREDLSNIHIDVEVDSDTQTHELLSTILQENEYHNLQTNLSLSGIRSDLSNIHIDVEVDSDTETHSLISELIYENDKLSTKTHDILNQVRSDLANIHFDVEVDSDTETHYLLSGVIDSIIDHESSSNQLTSNTNQILEDMYNIFKTGDFDISNLYELPQLQKSNIELLEKIENRLNWKPKTKTVSQKIEEDFILMEDIPDEARYGAPEEICFGENTELKQELFTCYFPNARRTYSSPEISHPDYFIHAEQSTPDRCVQNYNTFHTDTQISMRLENPNASQLNSYELTDYKNLHENGLLENITIYNESNYPILFHCGEDTSNVNKDDDMMSLDAKMAVKISFDEADKIFVKRPFSISGYNVKYAIQYKVPID